MTKQARTIGLPGAVAIGLASMLGAGVFVVFREGYELAGVWVWLALAIAALVAALNSTSVFHLARLVDRPGGTYAYARVFLSEHWSFAAGFAFVAGKIGSIAAIALALGEYLLPQAKVAGALGAVGLMALVNAFGIKRTAGVAGVLAVTTGLFVAFTVALGALLPGAPAGEVGVSGVGVVGGLGADGAVAGEHPQGFGWPVFTAAAIFFFAFAGYARVATLGSEVRDARRNIPRAIVLVLCTVTALYFGVLWVLWRWLGTNLATFEAPFVAFFDRALPGTGWLVLPVVAVASLGSILALLAGVSRTAAEMAADRELPRVFARRNRFGSPYLAEVAIALGAALLIVAATDLAWAIGFSSFSVLFYYAVAHLAAMASLGGRVAAGARAGAARERAGAARARAGAARAGVERAGGSTAGLGAEPRGETRPVFRAALIAVGVLGIIGCLVLAFCVPGPAFVVSSAVLVAAVLVRSMMRRR